MALVADLPLSVAVEYVVHALERERDQVVWELWSRVYPLMAVGLADYKGYSEFRSELLRPRIQYSGKGFEEIEAEMLAVVAAYEGRW